MNALKELRQMADLQDYGLAYATCAKIGEIADRIESEWMELPRDKDREVIHLRDEVRNPDGNESSGPVAGFRKDSIGRVYVLVTGVDHERCWLVSDVELVKPDTWERIEKDADMDTCSYYGSSSLECSGCRGKISNIPSIGCYAAHRKEIFIRCKVLAGASE